MKYAVPNEDEMFQINTHKPIESNIREVLCYTVAGKEDFKDSFGYPRITHENNPSTHAKCVHAGDHTKFFIKMSNGGRIFDPIGMFDETQRLRESRHAGRPNWTWRTTKETVFKFYIEYLKTKNASYLLNAERNIA